MCQYQIISICQRTINKLTMLKKAHLCLNIMATQTKWIQSILKTIFEFIFCKWLRPRHCLVRWFLIPLQLWQSKTLFGDGLINFNKFFLKKLRPVALRRWVSALFYSIIMDENFFWKSFLYQRRCWRDASPNSWSIFSLGNPLISPGRAR